MKNPVGTLCLLVYTIYIGSVFEFVQGRIARHQNSHAIQTPAMAERGGVPVRRLAEGVSSHLRSSGSDSRPRLYCHSVHMVSVCFEYSHV
eukprot:6183245-Pleurochrysis_carterae.AAC.1